MIDDIKFLIKRNKIGTYEDFLKYFYFYYDEKIKSEKSQNIRDKYIKARKNLLSYILGNKQEIIKEINKNK